MKALLVPGEELTLELLAESQAERDELLRVWNEATETFAVTCEEWRDCVAKESTG